ncbi:hypothetical protein C0J52_10899 [Blattella germanica]|nr:hypothetical protein C0J52_10899 [Blattella germanica]
MPSQSCYVPGCRNGYMLNYKQKRKGIEPISLFRPPQDLVEAWSEIIQRKDRKLLKDDIVCALHFKDEDIEYYYSHVIDGEVVLIKRGYPKLKPGALPCFLNNEKKIVQKKIPRKSQEICPPQLGKYNINSDPTKQVNTGINRKGKHKKMQQTEQINSDNNDDDLFDVEYLIMNEEDNSEIKFQANETEEANEIVSSIDLESVSPNESAFTYEELLSDINSISLPSSCWGVHKDPLDRFVAFAHVQMNPEKGLKYDKAVLFEGSCSPIIMFYGHAVPIPQLSKDMTCIEDVCNLLNELEEFRPVCLLSEGPSKDIIPLED